MKNKIKIFTLILNLILFFSLNAFGNEQFNFDITEIEITNKGNNFKGFKRGTITTNDGVAINADEFNYDKSLNILKAKGSVKIIDKINSYIIYTDNVTYLKNQEIIFTEGNSKGTYDDIIIKAQKFNYDKKLNIIIAEKNVEFDDTQQDIKIFSNKIIYKKNLEEVYSKGFTEAIIEKKYNFSSIDVLLNRDNSELSSSHKTNINDDNYNFYELDEFKYFRNKDLLKGKNVKITTNKELKDKPSDKYFFLEGFFNLKNKEFLASKTKIHLDKNIFDNKDNDPRLYGTSSSRENDITKIKKGIFTSCKKNDKCPPWSLHAKTITHDLKKKQLTYDNVLLKIYDKPVLYFPKFFHPDPTVERQSGFLQPQLNSSNMLGTSFQIPYFYAFSKDKDFTFTPNIFDSNIYMLQSEFREKTKNSELISDFAYTKGYQSKGQSRNSISHLFAKYNKDLALEKFIKSDLQIRVEKTTNDTYLKVFDSNLNNTIIKPTNKDVLTSSISMELIHDNFDFSAGITSYETLDGSNSDRYQYILPYYDFSKNLFTDFHAGTINFSSSGDNNLKDTNNLRSKITNNIDFMSLDNYSDLGFKNNFNLYLKNLNTIGKNDSEYKASPQVELMSIFEVKSSLPLLKESENFDELLTPTMSFRINPSDMKNYSASNRLITADNIFDINRLGISDTFESGRSLTLGIDYKKEKFNSEKNINNYFEIKLASTFRDKFEKNIPNMSTLNNKNSNLFGSVKNSLNDIFEFNYQFSIDNNFERLEHNSLNSELNLGAFSTGVEFIKQSGNVGDTNSIKNYLTYKVDESNFLSFETRRNRKINLTEYYDLIYEYKNDCLIAGLKYKKTFYQDRDLLPAEDLMFSITIFPLTTYEKKFDRNR